MYIESRDSYDDTAQCHYYNAKGKGGKGKEEGNRYMFDGKGKNPDGKGKGSKGKKARDFL